MSELTEEWKRFRQEFGNFLCKLDNVANRAIAADEQRKKVYDSAFESGWAKGVEHMTNDKNYIFETDAIHDCSITEIQAELEKDISNAKRKAAAATELENEQYEKAKIQKEYEMMAYKQRTYYDELVKAGFTEEQAWEMVRMPFGIPYTTGYAV